MNWITLEELILVHERIIVETGGIHGMINYDVKYRMGEKSKEQ